MTTVILNQAKPFHNIVIKQCEEHFCTEDNDFLLYRHRQFPLNFAAFSPRARKYRTCLHDQRGYQSIRFGCFYNRAGFCGPYLGGTAPLLAFLEQLPSLMGKYLFAVANNGGQVSNTLVQLQKAMEAKGLSLSGGWSVELPSNYIPWGGPGSAEEQQERFAAARLKISAIAQGIRRHIKKPVEKGLLWQRILFTWIYNLSFPQGYWHYFLCFQ